MVPRSLRSGGTLPRERETLYVGRRCMRFSVLLVPERPSPLESASNAVTRGFKKPDGMALELVYRAENPCKSKVAPAGAFPKPPGAGLGKDASQNRRLPVPSPPADVFSERPRSPPCLNVRQ